MQRFKRKKKKIDIHMVKQFSKKETKLEKLNKPNMYEKVKVTKQKNIPYTGNH